MTATCQTNRTDHAPTASELLRDGGPTALFDRVRGGEIDTDSAFEALDKQRESIRERFTGAVVWIVIRTFG